MPAPDSLLSQVEAHRSRVDVQLGAWRWSVFLALLLFSLFALVPRLLEWRIEPLRARVDTEVAPAYDLTMRLGTVLAREAVLAQGRAAGPDAVVARELARVREEESAVLGLLRARTLVLGPAVRAEMERLDETLPPWRAALSTPPVGAAAVERRVLQERVGEAHEGLRRSLAAELAARRAEVRRAESFARTVLAALSAAALIAAILVALSAMRLARVLRETRGVAERVVRLQAVTEALSRVLTPDEVARTIVYQGLAALDAGCAYLALLGPDGKRLYLEVGVGAAQAREQAAQREPLGDRGLAAEAVRQRKPLWLGSSRERHQELPGLQLERWESGCEAWVALPLLAAGRPLGVLGLGFTRPRDFSAISRGLPLAVARLGAEALERSRLYAEAEEASRLKSGLIVTMSDEIRTPLNSVIGYVELLGMGLTGPVSEGYKRPLRSIRESARQILQVVEDVLSHLQLDARGEALRMQWVELAPLLDEVVSAAEPRAARAGTRVRVRIHAPDEAGRVELDPVRVRRILVDLLENAVAYAPAGKVDLVARVLSGEVVFEVHDSGPAIDPAELEQVFLPPPRATEPAAVRTGLSLTRRLTRLLGGSISVASRPGEGNTFTLHLPARTEPAPPATPAASTPPTHAGAGARPEER